MSGFDVLQRELTVGASRTARALRTGTGMATLLLVALPLAAQDLDPRSYANVPVNGTFLVSGFSLSRGGVVTDPTLPITDINATIETPSLGLGRSFSLFGKTAQAFAALPRTVTGNLFVQVVTGNREAYAQCLTEAKRRRPTLAHVDASVTVTGEGLVVDVSTTPADTALGLCLKPVIERLALPRFQAQQDRFVVPLDLE